MDGCRMIFVGDQVFIFLFQLSFQLVWLCFNAHHEPIEFTLSPTDFGPAWIPIIDTAADARVIALRRAGSTITGHNPQTLSSRGKRIS
jgi:hypothetical protein